MAVRRLLTISSFLLVLVLAIQPGVSGAVPQSSKKKTKSSKKQTHSSRLSPAALRKLQHMNRAFVASADLKPMAQQLLQFRPAQAYAGVEAYARKHQKDEAGPLAWMVLGYAHYLDKDYAQSLTDFQKANALQPVLGDYLDYLRASDYEGQQDTTSILKILQGFEEKYPDSLFVHDATLLYADAQAASGSPQKAAAFLEKHRQPTRADIEFALAKAYLKAGETTKATEIYRRLFYEMPLSPEADNAAVELHNMGEAVPAGSFEQRHARASMLLKNKRYTQAVAEFSSLVEQGPSASLPELQVEFATALYRDRKRDEAKKLFDALSQNQNASAEVRAQALYFLAEVARDKDDRDRHSQLISQLRTLAPDSVWFQEALLSAGNMYLLRKDMESAQRFYAEIFERQRNGRFSPYAHWKAAWLNYRLGKKDDAKRLFEEQIAFYPGSAEAANALYWRGRMAEEDHDLPVARAYYQKLSENFRYFYYANLGRDRLIKIGFTDVGEPPVLNKLKPLGLPAQTWEPPVDNLRVKRAQVLANAALYDFAVKEIQAAAEGSPPWEAVGTAQIYADSGSYNRAIETLKRAVPNYFSADLNQLPRPVWENLFPRPYWEDLKKHSLLNQLDPFLVASLIRQESEFNPAAYSRANAMGLMQLLPTVGKGMAKEVKLRGFSNTELFVPNINLQLGTRYFKRMVDHYNGQVEYALAAYNAGEDRVDEWRKANNFKDVEEFVESIPFTETREYVQAIKRNAVLYKLLYPKG
ncbi:MAG: lytic transglycosylase [Candidatus Angelobacter sp. Gp1-AA117]|nr:MAG: lytic transglycosylase [Candidatus Angelobacter sp. Gp1-AA117]